MDLKEHLIEKVNEIYGDDEGLRKQRTELMNDAYNVVVHLDSEHNSDVRVSDDQRTFYEEIANKILNYENIFRMEDALTLLAVTKSDPIRILTAEFGDHLKKYKKKGIERRHFVCPAIRTFDSMEMAYALDQTSSYPFKKYPLAVNCPGYYAGIREFLIMTSDGSDQVELKQIKPLEYMFDAVSQGINVDGYNSVLEACPSNSVKIALKTIKGIKL